MNDGGRKQEAMSVLAHRRNGTGPGYELCGASSVRSCKYGREAHERFDSMLALAQCNAVEEAGAWYYIDDDGTPMDELFQPGHAMMDVGLFRTAVERGFEWRYTLQEEPDDAEPVFDPETVEEALRRIAREPRRRTYTALTRGILPPDPTGEPMPPEMLWEDLADAIDPQGTLAEKQLRTLLEDGTSPREDDLEYGAEMLREHSPAQARRAAHALAEHLLGLDPTSAAASTMTKEDDASYRRLVTARANGLIRRYAALAGGDADAMAVVEHVAAAWAGVVRAAGNGDGLETAIQRYAQMLNRVRFLDDITVEDGSTVGAASRAEVWRTYRDLMWRGRYDDAVKATRNQCEDAQRLLIGWEETHPSPSFRRDHPEASGGYEELSGTPGFPAELDLDLSDRYYGASQRIAALLYNPMVLSLAQGTGTPHEERAAMAGNHYGMLLEGLGETRSQRTTRGDWNYRLYGRFALTRDGNGTITTDPDQKTCCARWLAAMIAAPKGTRNELGDDYEWYEGAPRTLTYEARLQPVSTDRHEMHAFWNLLRLP